MSSAENGRECKVRKRSRSTRGFVAVHEPIPQRLCPVPRLAGPCHLTRPALVANPVTGEVVRAGIDEYFDAALEERSDVQLGLAKHVARALEVLVQLEIDSGPVSEGLVDAKDFPRVRVVEVLVRPPMGTIG